MTRLRRTEPSPPAAVTVALGAEGARLRVRGLEFYYGAEYGELMYSGDYGVEWGLVVRHGGAFKYTLSGRELRALTRPEGQAVGLYNCPGKLLLGLGCWLLAGAPH